MKLRAILALAGTLMLAGSIAAPSVSAAPQVVLGRFFDDDSKKKKKKKKKSGKAKAAGKKPTGPGPTQLSKKIKIKPKGLRWGLSLKEVSKLYEKVLEREFRPLYKRVQPGVKMEALDEELRIKKGLIRRSHVKFGATPTGVDYTALKGEYTYRNKESMSHLVLRSGVKRHFFFFDNKLWKVYDEFKLKKGSALGTSYESAVSKLTKKFKRKPRMRKGGGEDGPKFTENDWADGTTVVRVVDREYEKIVGIVYVDEGVLDRIDSYRTNKADDPHAIDKDVERATSPKSPAKGKKKKRKK